MTSLISSISNRVNSQSLWNPSKWGSPEYQEYCTVLTRMTRSWWYDNKKTVHNKILCVLVGIGHNSDIIRTSWRLKPREIQLFIQHLVNATNKDNVKVPHYWPLWRGILTSGSPEPEVNTGSGVKWAERSLIVGTGRCFMRWQLLLHLSRWRRVEAVSKQGICSVF